MRIRRIPKESVMGERLLTILGVNKAGSGTGETVLGRGTGTCYAGEISCNFPVMSGNGPQAGQKYVVMVSYNEKGKDWTKTYRDLVCRNPGNAGQGVVFKLKDNDTCPD
jgi:hypothetical protein